MENDCQIYVDPEEDEVFFGSVSEREKKVCAELVKPAVPSPKSDCDLKKVLDESVVIVDDCTDGRLKYDQSIETEKEIVGKNRSTDSIPPSNELNNFSENIPNSNKIHLNTSVELEHNYSTPMKQKIDKSILATPKSIVKADKDGGFLKVLSEIALVKAEAEGDSNSDYKREDENKENKNVSAIPEIKVTEATPEKGRAVASPPNNINSELRKFRIIYNSPRNEENISQNSNQKSNSENFERERNLKNKNQDIEFLGSNGKKSFDLIDFTDPNFSPKDKTRDFEKKKKEEGEEVKKEEKSVPDIVKITDSHEVGLDENVKKDDEVTPRPHATTLRFSKEARKVVEVLKKSTVEDTLNFTIPEINIEEEENSFLSPEPMTTFDETVVSIQNPTPVLPKNASPKFTTRPPIKSKTIEKEQNNRTPVVTSQQKYNTVKYFSERKVWNQVEGGEEKKCAKKLPLDEKVSATLEKPNGVSHQVLPSKIPMFAAKNSKIPLFERVARSAPSKTTPSKTPSTKSFKNSKFDHIESPINAYIHNKPTALVLNVKPDGKKESVSKVWKSQTTGGIGKKIQENPSKEQKPKSAVKLPFVEYKSATPYNIEKRPESRLPRLAPTVCKLIGSNSPKVLRHEGRFFMNSPRKGKSTESTIVADPNEVSVVVSQPAQKSRSIK